MNLELLSAARAALYLLETIEDAGLYGWDSHVIVELQNAIRKEEQKLPF